MTRSIYLHIFILLTGALVISALSIAAWIVALIPVMIYPELAGSLNGGYDKITAIVTRKMIQSAMRKQMSDAGR